MFVNLKTYFCKLINDIKLGCIQMGPAASNLLPQMGKGKHVGRGLFGHRDGRAEMAS